MKSQTQKSKLRYCKFKNQFYFIDNQLNKKWLIFFLQKRLYIQKSVVLL
jgi:hypothetical protein